MRDSAALTQLTVRLEQIEHEYGARLDKLSESASTKIPLLQILPILRRGSISWRK